MNRYEKKLERLDHKLALIEKDLPLGDRDIIRSLITGLKYGILFMLIFTIVSTTFFLLSPTVSASSDINYVFSQDYVYDDELPLPLSEFNMRNSTSNTKNYNSSETFYGDTEGSNPTDWTTSEGASTDIHIVETYDDHDTVLYSNDYGTNACYTYNTFSNQAYGTISFWMQISGTSSNRNQDFEVSYSGNSDSDNLYRFIWNEDDLKVQHNGGTTTIISDLVADKWYYIETNFESTTGSYKELSQYDFNVYVNNESYGSFDMMYNKANANRIVIETWGGTCNANEPLYWDAFLYSWDTEFEAYYNVIPEFQTLNETETDRWTFSFDDEAQGYAVGDYEINGWNITGNDNNGFINITEEDGYNRAIEFGLADTLSSSVVLDLNHDIYEDIDNYFVFNTTLNMELVNPVLEYFCIRIVDSDDNYIAEIKFQLTTKFIVYIGGSSEYTYNYGFTPDPINQDLIFDIRIAYGMINILFNNSVVASGYTSATQIKRINYHYYVNVNKEDYLDPIIKDVGIYINEDSDCTDEMPENIFPLEIDLKTSEHPYIYFDFDNNFINNVSIYLGSDLLLNGVQDDIFFKLPNSYIYDNAYLYILNYTSFNITNIQISGIKMTDGTNNYYGLITGNNINLNNSIFWVSNGKLYYDLIVDDSNTEYMQITFNIQNIYSINRSCSIAMESNDTNTMYIQIDYTDSTSTIIENSIGSYENNVILPQTKVINQFVLVASDDDLYTNNTFRGHYGSFSLIYYPDINLIIATTSLIAIIVPLMILIVPPITITGFLSTRDKELAKNAFIPLLMVMALICLIGSLIPAWVFFILILSGGFLIYLMRRKL